MFLFKLTTGKCILHTGDFRASPEMEEYPEFWNNSIDSIYLDTTYLSKRYAFQSQIESISEVKLQCGEFLKKNETVGRERCLIVCGAYKIGKEKVWMSIADEFGFKVYIDKERRKAMECLDDPNVLSKLSPNPNEANIHVLPLGNLSYQRMVQYLVSRKLKLCFDFRSNESICNSFICSSIIMIVSMFCWLCVQVAGKVDQGNQSIQVVSHTKCPIR